MMMSRLFKIFIVVIDQIIRIFLMTDTNDYYEKTNIIHAYYLK